jgi:hypothetical protein
VERVDFRPSLRDRIRHTFAQLSGEEERQARAVIAGTLAPAQVTSVGALTGVSLYDQQRLIVSRGQETAAEERRQQDVLLRLSQLPPLPSPDGDPPPAVHMAHGSHQLAGDVGSAGTRRFVGAALRPGLHGLLDPDAGYARNGAIELMTGEARLYEGERLPILEQLALIRLESLQPQAPFGLRLRPLVSAEA